MTLAATVPLRAGTEESARILRQALDRAGFTEKQICERLGANSLENVGMPLFNSLADRIAGPGLFEDLVRLFVFGEMVAADVLRVSLTEEELSAFVSSDLIRTWEQPSAGAAERFYSPVRLVPVKVPLRAGDLLLVGDRGDNPDRSAFVPFSDIVFTGHNPLTRQFLRLLPSSPCGSTLDLCAGSAVGALTMASVAERCTAGDIAERSVHFGRFNTWINGCDRLDFVCGDLYEPVAGRMFDRIIAHPPYVPALTNKLTFRDGGRTGDEIVHGVVAGAPAHLNEGGTFHLLCLGMDTGEGPFEQRARDWLGDARSEFDVVFALDSQTPPEVIASRLTERSGSSYNDLIEWRDLFKGLRVEQFVYGALAGRRFRRGSGEAFTRRVLLTADCSGEGFEWLFQWFDWLRLPSLRERVMTLRPKLAPDLRLEVRHQVDNNEFVPRGYALVNGGRPFFARLETEAWVAGLLNGFDGTRTVHEAFKDAVERARVPSDFTETDLERLMCFLLERRCIVAD